MLVPASRTLRARTGSRAPHKAKEHAVSGKVIGVHGEIGAAACVRDGRTRGEIAVPSFCILSTHDGSAHHSGGSAALRGRRVRRVALAQRVHPPPSVRRPLTLRFGVLNHKRENAWRPGSCRGRAPGGAGMG